MQLVHHHDASHDRDPEITNFAELALEMTDVTVEPPGKLAQMLFLALFASHPIGL